MTIFLLTVTALLFILRIKNIPNMLSKKAYTKKIKDYIEKNTATFEKQKDEKTIELMKEFILVIRFIAECLFGLYYIVLGTHIGLLYFTILTVLQILTVIETSRRQLNMKVFSSNIEDFKFYRWYFLFNVVLDLAYYPMAIYLLLK